MGAVEDFFNKLTEIAEDMGLEDTDKEEFINRGMKQKGFTPKIAWADPNDDGRGDGFFGSGKKREQRRVSGSNQGGFFD